MKATLLNSAALAAAICISIGSTSCGGKEEEKQQAQQAPSIATMTISLSDSENIPLLSKVRPTLTSVHR